MYQHELARSGKSLFAIRGAYIYLIIAIGILISWVSRSLGPFNSDAANWAWFWVSLIIALAGAAVRIVTSGYAALGTSGNTKKGAVASELNMTGPYSLVRNPLYVGRILNFTGIAMLSGSWIFGALVLLMSILIYERISIYEEEFLRETFGAAHADWAKNVPALFPRFAGWEKPKYPFWFRRMFWRENKKIFWLCTTLIVNDFARRGFDSTAITPAAAIWYYAYGAIVSGEVVVRALRHFTKTFDGLS